MLLRTINSLEKSWQKFKYTLLPSSCVLCAVTLQAQGNLCEACIADLPWLTSGCVVCAIPLTTSDVICGQCLQKTLPFSVVHALFCYKSPIDKFITDLKFQQQLLYARLFGELLSVQLQKIYSNKSLPKLIIPVPLHKQRLRERGFNQALEIARPISKALSVPLDFRSCTRIRMTAAQSLLPANVREKNIKNAFAIKENLAAKHVAIVDDVITTGSTITELCKTLRQVGVEQIDVWCVARTETH